MPEPGLLDMVKQARDLQKKMNKVQKRIAKTEITANAGGGMVTAVVNGNLEVKRVSIEPDLVRGGDVRMIEDLVRSALNAAIKKAQDLMAEEMKQVTGGMKIPGLF
ncbi:MAG: YbaB/EbfC family nucleoid-associated protein [Deltaproteobacteria bacterium]|nr:MAG: YbaB/EbfC family nucleoid-associated protein [Deltaproteobacteria bacterium]